ncbi:sensor histidine kinase [Cohnella sp. GbtcB17]|uniref:sensor histidine kinase n=1 Tax=Cohnella sp. GbtcB17 TaxID=2824762 RepID=UPI001C3114C9|nr:histidine kinase [Cohnella sp. GbtcB17]
MVKMNSFAKVNILILILLVPLLTMYMISNRTSVSVLERHIRESQLDRMTYLYRQLDNNVNQLSMMANMLLRDPTVREFRDMELYENDMNYNALKTVQTISQKLMLQSVANAFTNSVVIYAPKIGKAVGQSSLVYYDAGDIAQRAVPDWRYDAARDRFVLYAFDPISEQGLAENARLIVEVGFTADNIVKLLDNNDRAQSGGGTFLLDPARMTSIVPVGSASIADRLKAELGGRTIESRGYDTIEIDHVGYFVNYMQSEELGWYLVDYVPVQDILTPITESRRYFILFASVLLVVSLLISYVLYQNIRRPIKALIRGVQQLKKGNYAARIPVKKDNEFTFLFHKFNDMAEEIDLLVGKVYAEQLRSREATLKQLQSQINSHFLYNCLAFMKSMAVLEEKEAIIAMSVSLSKYYRYTTRNEHQLVAVREEMALVDNYLRIQGLQMKRLRVSIELPDALLDKQIPRLLIQPVVENAIVHGIEPRAEAGSIVIRGSSANGEHTIVVEDDGPGMTEEARGALSRKINLPLTDEIGCGLWNVHQRLRYQFGDRSGLRFEASAAGGLTTILHWHDSIEE